MQAACAGPGCPEMKQVRCQSGVLPNEWADGQASVGAFFAPTDGRRRYAAWVVIVSSAAMRCSKAWM